MKEQLENKLVVCVKCSTVREKFLVGCPKCGAVENEELDSTKKGYYEITLEVIQKGKLFYKKELNDEQRTWFSDRIPNGQSWQFYAGIILINNLNTIWLNSLTQNQILDRDYWEQPICCGNARVFHLMSFMSKEKQNNFCNFLNAFSHERIRDENRRKEDQTNLQGEIGNVIEDTSS